MLILLLHMEYFSIFTFLAYILSLFKIIKQLNSNSPWVNSNCSVNVLPLQLTTLRGAILEDAIPSTARHGTARGLPLKEVLEYVIPELSIQCLRQASNSPKVPEQLLKLDEQGVGITCSILCSCVNLFYISKHFEFCLSIFSFNPPITAYSLVFVSPDSPFW